MLVLPMLVLNHLPESSIKSSTLYPLPAPATLPIPLAHFFRC